MVKLRTFCEFLEAFAPPRLAEEWDNVGLLAGDPEREIRRVMTCLTITPASAAEAVARQADVIVTHHPLPFRPLKRLTTDTLPGRLLWQLVGAGVAIYSPHTAFDSAAAGINQQLAVGLGLTKIAPLLVRVADPDGLGSGRMGVLPMPGSLAEVAQRVCRFLDVDGVQVVGDPGQRVQRVAVACGSAGTFLGPARQAGCDVLVTGETNFHTCLEAEADGVGLVLPGHFASERFALLTLAERIAEEFESLEVWASAGERDPVRYVGRE
jgi:dinuclear metal center YbgI/SA1388 family protein